MNRRPANLRLFRIAAGLFAVAMLLVAASSGLRLLGVPMSLAFKVLLATLTIVTLGAAIVVGVTSCRKPNSD